MEACQTGGKTEEVLDVTIRRNCCKKCIVTVNTSRSWWRLHYEKPDSSHNIRGKLVVRRSPNVFEEEQTCCSSPWCCNPLDYVGREKRVSKSDMGERSISIDQYFEHLFSSSTDPCGGFDSSKASEHPNTGKKWENLAEGSYNFFVYDMFKVSSQKMWFTGFWVVLLIIFLVSAGLLTIWIRADFKHALAIVGAGEVRILLTFGGTLIIISTVYVLISFLVRLREFEFRLQTSFSISVFMLIVHTAVVFAFFMYIWDQRIMDSQVMNHEMESKLNLARIVNQTTSVTSTRGRIIKSVKRSSMSPRKQWDDVQKSFNCCGIRDYQDWTSGKVNSLQSVPTSCGKNETEIKSRFGCRTKVKHHIQKWRIGMAVIGCVACILPIIAFAIFVFHAYTTKFSLEMGNPSLCFFDNGEFNHVKHRVLANEAEKFLKDLVRNKPGVLENDYLKNGANAAKRTKQPTVSAKGDADESDKSNPISVGNSGGVGSRESKQFEQVLEVIIKSVALQSKVSFLQPTKMLLHHSYLVIRTTNWWWSVEREDGYILIQRNKERNMVDDCRFGKPRPRNFFGRSGPHQVKKVGLMDMYDKVDIMEYFERVLLTTDEKQKTTEQGGEESHSQTTEQGGEESHSQTTEQGGEESHLQTTEQGGEVSQSYDLLERNCQHLTENSYRFFRSGRIEEDIFNRRLLRVCVPVFTVLFVCLIVILMAFAWIPRSIAVQDMLDSADTKVLMTCSVAYGLILTFLAVYSIFKSRVIELDPKALEVLIIKLLKVLGYYFLMTVAFALLWLLYVSNDERVQFKMDSKFLLASSVRNQMHQTTSTGSSGLEKTNSEALRNWDRLQECFKCCGITSYQDWGNSTGSIRLEIIPDSCGESAQEKKTRRGCKRAVEKFLERFELATSITTGIVLAFGFLIVCGFHCKIKVDSQRNLDNKLKPLESNV